MKKQFDTVFLLAQKVAQTMKSYFEGDFVKK